MLVSFWMTQRLTREIHHLEKQVFDKQTELDKYQRYAGALGANTNLNALNIAGLPSELTARATLFAQYADQASSMSAMQNLQMMKAMGRIPYLNNQMSQYQIEMSAFANFKQEAMKALKQQEVNILNKKEEEIRLELNQLRVQLETKKEELNNTKQLCSEKAKDCAVKFSL